MPKIEGDHLSFSGDGGRAVSWGGKEGNYPPPLKFSKVEKNPLTKIENFGAMKSTFPVPDFFPLHYMNSQTSLIACISAEDGAAALIVLGVATRPAAFMLGFTMVVAAFHTHHGAPWFMGPGVEASKEPALLYLIPMIAVILTGAGSFSIDAIIHKEGKRRRW